MLLFIVPAGDTYATAGAGSVPSINFLDLLFTDNSRVMTPEATTRTKRWKLGEKKSHLSYYNNRTGVSTAERITHV